MPPVLVELKVDPQTLAAVRQLGHGHQLSRRGVRVQGTVGDLPNPREQTYNAPVVVTGQLTSIEEFGNVILRANPNGSTVRLKDVARVEQGAESYNFTSRLNGQPSAAIAIQLSSTGNAVAVSNAVNAALDGLIADGTLERIYARYGVDYRRP